MFFISHEGKWFRLLMVFIFLGAAMETDIYLPTFPDILSDFNTNAVMVQRILSYNFIGIFSALYYTVLYPIILAAERC